MVSAETKLGSLDTVLRENHFLYSSTTDVLSHLQYGCVAYGDMRNNSPHRQYKRVATRTDCYRVFALKSLDSPTISTLAYHCVRLLLQFFWKASAGLLIMFQVRPSLVGNPLPIRQ